MDDAMARATAGKGRPTPKRREQEARNRRPLVGKDPRLARKEQRKRNAEQREAMNQAMLTGDERNMPYQHRGSQRRYVRDYIDARWSIAEFFLPIAIVFVIATFALGNNPNFALPLLVLLYGIIIVAVLDSYLAGRRARNRLRERHGEAQRGTIMYAVMRSFQLRRTRMPKPQVKRGQFPS